MPIRRNKSIHETLARLAAAEREFLKTEFFAPALRGRGVRVRIAGVVCNLRVHPRSFEGWGVFRPASHSEAKLKTPATLRHRRKYLDLLPRAWLVVCQTGRQRPIALPAGEADDRFDIDGPVELLLVDEDDGLQLFEPVVARFDGSQFWFDARDELTDPAAAAYLRSALAAMTPPEKLSQRGLLRGQRQLYAALYRHRLEQALEERKHLGEYRLGDALAHAGARLRDFAEMRNHYRVTYEVDGRRHTSVVRKDDLTVQTSGICLSGQDRNFDLASLVGVLRVAGARRPVHGERG